MEVTAFLREIMGQSAALANLVAQGSAAWGGLASHRPERIVLTGMGASFHAAMWGAHVLNVLGLNAVAVECSELLYFPGVFSNGADTFIVISQSGGSAELAPVLDRLPQGVCVLGITNRPDSLLGRRSAIVLDIAAGDEATVATKTYLNTLAALWVTAHLWAGRDVAPLLTQVGDLSRSVGALTDKADEIGPAWCDRLLGCSKLVFSGHGPHVPAARQGAMMLSEWSKRQALGIGIGAFRHGFLEFSDADTGIVLLGRSGATDASVVRLAQDMQSYGATVVGVVEGQLVEVDATVSRQLPEELSALLDVVPMQIFVEHAARRLGVAPGFRHISKVIERL